MREITVNTQARSEMIDITARIQEIVRDANIREGVCRVFVPHTTAAVTINENADPDVPRDILAGLDLIVPRDAGYRHREGNSAAHIKSSLIGASSEVLVANGELALGIWQAVFFCEFDGPRTRKVLIHFSE